jgi:hypothetical protein
VIKWFEDTGTLCSFFFLVFFLFLLFVIGLNAGIVRIINRCCRYWICSTGTLYPVRCLFLCFDFQVVILFYWPESRDLIDSKCFFFFLFYRYCFKMSRLSRIFYYLFLSRTPTRRSLLVSVPTSLCIYRYLPLVNFECGPVAVPITGGWRYYVTPSPPCTRRGDK